MSYYSFHKDSDGRFGFMDDYGYPVRVRWFLLAVHLNSAGGY